MQNLCTIEQQFLKCFFVMFLKLHFYVLGNHHRHTCKFMFKLVILLAQIPVISKYAILKQLILL